MKRRHTQWKWKSVSHVPLFATPWTIQSMNSSRPEYWSKEPFPSPGDHPNPGIESRSPTLQADSLPAESLGKPKNSGVGSLSLSRGSSQPRNWTGVFCIAGGFFINWTIREAQRHSNQGQKISQVGGAQYFIILHSLMHSIILKLWMWDRKTELETAYKQLSKWSRTLSSF